MAAHIPITSPPPGANGGACPARPVIGSPISGNQTARLPLGALLPTAIAAIGTTPPDALLLAVADRWLRSVREAAWLAELSAAAPDPATSDSIMARARALTMPARDLLRQAIALPATSTAGMVAKATVLAQLVEGDDRPAAALAGSLARDLIGEVRA
ncbi:hypothetical protein M0638_20505 [Roseomonas sp. NAR14]|uniref:Uncharacterized protein n=1 Tax=Roseomonas acroporae TaxID=2937791 RepID=A0A9X1YBL9_9PROT|nr:hypothetical protein [Roseomonas acroporae]MCK8786757.1 hypothetical protein [Roseomonas acroporae]